MFILCEVMIELIWYSYMILKLYILKPWFLKI